MLPDLYQRVTEYSDEELTFFMNMFADAKRLEWALGHLHRHYASARVIVCSDNNNDPSLGRIVKVAEAEFHREESRNSMSFGGRIMHRLLELFFQNPSRYLFKIDRDTCIHRRFHWLPGHFGAFGPLLSDPLLSLNQGGCCGFTLNAAGLLFRLPAFMCRLLNHPKSSLSDASVAHKVREKSGPSLHGLVDKLLSNGIKHPKVRICRGTFPLGQIRA